VGNKLGWIIGIGLVVVVALVITFTVIFPSPSRPTVDTTVRGTLEFKKIDASPVLVLGHEPAGPGNAGDDYAKAVKLYKTSPEEFDEALRSRVEVAMGEWPLTGQVLSAFEQMDRLVAAGAKKKDMEYTFVHTPKTFDVSLSYGPADDLQKLGGALETLALHYYSKKKYAEARKVLEHLFTLGWHMTNERVRVDMVSRGLSVQGTAIETLLSVYKVWDSGGNDPHTAQTADLEKYNRARRAMRRTYDRKVKVVWNTKPKPGDVFNIIENDKDRAFRVQGLLALGIVKFTARTRGDERRAGDLIKDYSESSDPYEAAAAKAAGAMTRIEFNQLGTKGF